MLLLALEAVAVAAASAPCALKRKAFAANGVRHGTERQLTISKARVLLSLERGREGGAAAGGA
jgi:hypothetical protein